MGSLSEMPEEALLSLAGTEAQSQSQQGSLSSLPEEVQEVPDTALAGSLGESQGATPTLGAQSEGGTEGGAEGGGEGGAEGGAGGEGGWRSGGGGGGESRVHYSPSAQGQVQGEPGQQGEQQGADEERTPRVPPSPIVRGASSVFSSNSTALPSLADWNTIADSNRYSAGPSFTGVRLSQSGLASPLRPHQSTGQSPIPSSGLRN